MGRKGRKKGAVKARVLILAGGADPMVPRSFVVTRNHQDTHDTFTLDLRPVAGESSAFQAGQFVRIALDIDGERVACRRCLGVAYRVQSMGPWGRRERRRARIEAKLDMTSSVPDRSRGMRPRRKNHRRRQTLSRPFLCRHRARRLLPGRRAQPHCRPFAS